MTHRTKTDATYVELRERILGGALAPGSALNQEELAALLGVSTTPLREAIRRLESEGLIHAHAHRDVTVAPLDLEGMTQLYEVKQRLEPFGAHLAAERHTPEEARIISAACARTLRASSKRAWETNRTLHTEIYHASHNAVLIEFMNVLWDRYGRFRNVLGKIAVDPDVTEEHIPLVQAILDRDGEGAAMLMHRHLGHGRKLIEIQLESFAATDNSGRT